MRNGHSASRQNAVRHGIFADILLAGDKLGESRERYLALLSALRSSLRPADSFEELLVEKLSCLFLRLSRVYKADRWLAPKLFKKVGEALDASSSVEVVDILSADTEVVVCRRDPSPELVCDMRAR